MKKRHLMLLGVALLGWGSLTLPATASDTDSHATVGFYGTYHPAKKSSSESQADQVRPDNPKAKSSSQKATTTKHTADATINNSPFWQRWLPQTDEQRSIWLIIGGLLLLLLLITFKKRKRGTHS